MFFSCVSSMKPSFWHSLISKEFQLLVVVVIIFLVNEEKKFFSFLKFDFPLFNFLIE